MKAIIMALLLGSSITLGATDLGAPFDWTWRTPVMKLISGEVGASWIGGNEYYYGARGKIAEQRGFFARPDTEATIRDVVEGNGNVIAVGDGGLIWREDQGKRWLPISGGTSKNLSSAVYANRKWVIAGDNTVLYSTNLTNFTSVTFPVAFPQFSVRKAIYAWGRYFIFGTESPGTINARGFIAASEDGLSWQRPQVPDVGPLVDAVPGESMIVAVCSDGSIISSDTGADWTVRWRADEGINVQFVGIAWGGGKYVALGHDGFALTSNAGMSWAPLGSHIFGPDHHPLFSFVERYFDITFTSNPDVFHAYVRGEGLRKSFFEGSAGYSGAGINAIGNDIMVQSPGIQSFHSQGFSSELGPSFLSERILGGDGAFVAITRAGEIFYSTNVYDVNSWSLAFSIPNAEFAAAAFGNGRFVVVGNRIGEEGPSEGIIYSSRNGRDWVERLRTESILRDVAFGENSFTAVGQTNSAGISLVSPNGVDWTASMPLPNLPFDNVAAGLGIFVASAFSDRPEIFTSKDGVTWTEQPFSMDNKVLEIVFTGSTFGILGPAGEFLESNHTFMGISRLLTFVSLDVASTYPELIIEASSDLREWSLIANQTNRFRVGTASQVLTSVAVTPHYDEGTNSHRFFRARRPD